MDFILGFIGGFAFVALVFWWISNNWKPPNW